MGTWNIRSMNQSKLDVIRQEMARVNTDILGISWTKMDRKEKFNSDDHYTYYCGQESLRRNGVAHIVNKRIRNAVLGCNLTNDIMIFVCFQGKPFSIIVIQVYAPITNAKEAEVEQFYTDLQDLLELTPKKIPSLHSCSNVYWPPATCWQNTRHCGWLCERQICLCFFLTRALGQSI